jgi:hypothetical protein
MYHPKASATKDCQEIDMASRVRKNLAVRDWFIWFVSFNQTNQINKRIQPVLVFHAQLFVALADFFSILLARIIHEGSSRKRADATRDGHSEP